MGRPHAIMAIQFLTLPLQHMMTAEVHRKDDEAKKDQAGTMKYLYKIEKYILWEVWGDWTAVKNLEAQSVLQL